MLTQIATRVLRIAAEMDAKTEKKNQAKANADLNKLTHNQYFKSLPISDIIEILKRHGFDPGYEDPEGLSGIYTGREGKINPLQIGPKSYLALSWYKMESGNWEITTYVS